MAGFHARQTRARIARVKDETKPKYIYRAPPGECEMCDRNREDQMMPPHTASSRCESGKRPHCTCSVCY